MIVSYVNMFLPSKEYVDGLKTGPLKYWLNMLRYHFQRYEHPIVNAMEELTNTDSYTESQLIGYWSKCWFCDVKCYWDVYTRRNSKLECFDFEEVWDEENYEGDREIMIAFSGPDKHAGPFCKKCAPNAYSLSENL